MREKEGGRGHTCRTSINIIISNLFVTRHLAKSDAFLSCSAPPQCGRRMRMPVQEKERGIRITSNKARMVVGDGWRAGGRERDATVDIS